MVVAIFMIPAIAFLKLEVALKLSLLELSGRLAFTVLARYSHVSNAEYISCSKKYFEEL